MSRKLVYFNVNGSSEFLRYLLLYGDLKFEDKRIDFKDWGSLKFTMPFAQVPIYEENGEIINQSVAIGRYIASQAGLLPSEPWQQAKLDAVALTISDFNKKCIDYYFETMPAKRVALKEILDESIPFYMSRFENQLKAGNGYFGGKLSWADIMLVGSVEGFNLYLNTRIDEPYPIITQLVTKIQSLPRIKEYIANRNPYVPPPV